ncbi:hypothetical protein [Neptuniibacter sp.]|uniref:hypothetical protein n=1 Tax=Neptuniibacter sp. TaxID=1962643 RepID=UPI0026317B80|nr:hypothetical protein [Neptuniibacter sp.]MCP4598519.1 hypothetical protein [Neptuniibacter sp.]
MGRKAKNNKHGKKTKAGTLLSKYIKEIADEETEFIKDDERGDRMATKAEALARTIWKLALGFDETVTKFKKDGTEITTRLPHAPNSTYIGIILDRTEGRAPLLVDGKDGKLNIPDRISQEGKNRINNIIKDRKK